MDKEFGAYLIAWMQRFEAKIDTVIETIDGIKQGNAEIDARLDAARERLEAMRPSPGKAV